MLVFLTSLLLALPVLAEWRSPQEGALVRARRSAGRRARARRAAASTTPQTYTNIISPATGGGQYTVCPEINGKQPDGGSITLNGYLSCGVTDSIVCEYDNNGNVADDGNLLGCPANSFQQSTTGDAMFAYTACPAADAAGNALNSDTSATNIYESANYGTPPPFPVVFQLNCAYGPSANVMCGYGETGQITAGSSASCFSSVQPAAAQHQLYMTGIQACTYGTPNCPPPSGIP